MITDNTDSPNQQSPASNKRAGYRVWWLAGGLIVLCAVTLACLLVAGLGGFALRSVERQATAPQAVVEPATLVPAERLQEESSAATPLPEASAAAGASGRIAFIDRDGRLGTVAPDGADKRVLSEVGWRYQFPAWSPDGRRLAVVGSDGEQGAVRVFFDEPAAKQIELYNSRTQAPFYLYWSPDSRQVSFLANTRRGIGLWLAPADGQKEARLLATGQPFYWDWSGDSAGLLVHTGTLGEDARLGFIDTNGDALGEVIADPGLFQAPGLSSNGRYLAYAEVQNRDFRVVVEDQQSGARSSTPHTGLVALSWSPTDPILAFTSPRTLRASFAGPLQLLDATTGDVRTLVDDTVAGFFWSPTGRSIAYLTVEPRHGSPAAARPSGLAAAVSLLRLQQDHPEIRLKLGVVDVADGQQRLLTSFRPTDLFVTQFLPFFDQYALSHRLWSPAGDALALPMVGPDGQSGVYVVRAKDGEVRKLAPGSMATWSP